MSPRFPWGILLATWGRPAHGGCRRPAVACVTPGLLQRRVSGAVRRGATTATRVPSAWQVQGSWQLTGEPETFRGVGPRKPFDPAAGTWGAVEFELRAGAVIIDPATAFRGGAPAGNRPVEHFVVTRFQTAF